MARTAPRKRTAPLTKPQSKPTLPLSQPIPFNATSDSAFSSSKRDKAAIKHASLIHRIQKSSQKPLKRRRPNKKLVANLESLADALPDVGEGEGGEEIEVGQAVVKRKALKSMKSRPGAMKRKEKLEKMERERFQQNLAQMAVGSGSGQAGGSATAVQDRWAALKNHVQNNTERKAEFVGK